MALGATVVGEQAQKAPLPVVLQGQQLADGFAKYLSQLGLERKVKTQTLHDILKEDDEPEAAAPNGKPDVESCVSETLTANLNSSEPCANPPFCKSSVISMPGKEHCFDRCRMDGYVLPRCTGNVGRAWAS